MVTPAILRRSREQVRTGRRVARLLHGSWRPSPPPLPPELDPSTLASLVPPLLRGGTGGLAWWRLRDSRGAELEAVRPLRDAFRYQTLQARLLEGQLREAFDFLRSRGVEPILLKGWSVGRLYPAPGLRPYSDIDLLVPPSRHAEAEEARREPGAPAVPLELQPAPSELGDRSFEELMARSRLLPLGDTGIRLLAPEDELRLLCLHALKHGAWRPLWLCDIALYVEVLGPSLDWELVLAGDPWRSRGVVLALGLVRELLGAGAGVEGAPPPEPPPGWAVGATLREWGGKPHYLEDLHPGAYLDRPGALLRTARLRWANPIEVTYRRRAPFDRLPRLPFQAADYLSRGWGFLVRAPRYRRLQRRIREVPPPEDLP